MKISRLPYLTNFGSFGPVSSPLGDGQLNSDSIRFDKPALFSEKGLAGAGRMQIMKRERGIYGTNL